MTQGTAPPSPALLAVVSSSAAEPPVRTPRRTTGILLASLALIAALLPVNDVWLAQTVLVALLLIVPGLLLLRALRVPGDAAAASPAYVPCASLAVLLAAGLAVDLIGPLLGVTQPLRAAPLLIGTEAFCLVLLAVGTTAGSSTEIPLRSLGIRLRQAWPLLLPLVAAAGAARLTAGHGPAVAIVGAAAVAATLGIATLRAGQLSRSQLAVILYAAALALLWSFSLRSQFVYGFDIAKEHRFDRHLARAPLT
jgi:uncharacterized membrane protein